MLVCFNHCENTVSNNNANAGIPAEKWTVKEKCKTGPKALWVCTRLAHVKKWALQCISDHRQTNTTSAGNQAYQ